MSFQSRAIAFLVLITVFLPGHFWSQAAEPNEFYKGDSVLMAYFKECRAQIRQPGTIARCDTLFERAVAAGDTRMQAMALFARLDCFFYGDSTAEQVTEATERVKGFCRSHSWPELIRYYYSVSASRLVPYFMQHNQANAAVYETCKMLAEAKADAYPFGIANCYRILADIYFSQSDYRQAFDNYGLAIAEIERCSITDIPLAMQYASRAECALELNMPDSAAMLIGKGRQCALHGPYPSLVMNRISLLYDIHIRDFAAAKAVMEKTERMFAEERGLAPYRAELLSMQAGYYVAVGQYREALRPALAVRQDKTLRVSERARDEIDRFIGNIYYQLGDNANAVEHYQNYIVRSDSLRRQQSRLATNDLSGILEIVRLQNETKELQFGIQQRRLRTNYFIIFSLVLVLVLAGLNTVRTMRLNRRLKSSEARVIAQNAELKLQGEELMQAKEEAERASRMKSDFIQNMSHEVRTPLNSIVGFSQVLASLYRKDASTKEYAAIIETSSLNLLRLIDDVLDIAVLDQIDSLPCLDTCELNTCCRECADKVLLQMNPGVTMLLESSAENPMVRTNLRRISQVLVHLLHNAAKFTRKGQIRVNYTCLTEERLLRFIVTDTGPGIPPENRESVFERFVKLDAFSQGTGLGLPICRVIAVKLGGSLRLDESYERGCCFIFEVPFDPVDSRS